jgi:hypothetical protein
LIIGGSNIVGIASGEYTGWSLQSDGLPRAYGYSTNLGAYPNTVAIAASGDGTSLYDYLIVLSNDGFITEVPVLGQAAGLANIIPYIPSNPGNACAVAANGGHAVVLIGDGSPRIQWSPLSRVAVTGDTVVFSVGASGAATLSYQWQFNGTNIASATNTVLVLTNVLLASAGNYGCVVSNAVNVASTSPATLTVLRSIPQFSTATAGWVAGQGFSLELTQLSGHGSVILYASTNLVDWIPILTNPPQPGTLDLIDPAATNAPARFYRAREN